MMSKDLEDLELRELEALNQSLSRCLRQLDWKKELVNSAQTAASKHQPDTAPFSPTTRPLPSKFSYENKAKQLTKFGRTFHFQPGKPRFGSKERTNNNLASFSPAKHRNYDFKPSSRGHGHAYPAKQTLPRYQTKCYYKNSYEVKGHRVTEYEFETSGSNWRSLRQGDYWARRGQKQRRDRPEGMGFALSNGFARMSNRPRNESSYYFG